MTQPDAHDLMVAALGRADQGNLDAAEALIDQALLLEPENPAILTGLAVLRRKQLRVRDAVLACDAAIRLAPDYPDAWIERGSILASGGSGKAARESFLQALGLAPQSPRAHASLASLAAREGDSAAARHHAAAALRGDPGNALAISALASAELRDGAPDRARDLLEPLVQHLAAASPERSFALGLLGDAYDRLGEPDRAYSAYSACKADFAAINDHPEAGQLGNREFVEAIAEGFAAAPADAWRQAPGRQPANAKSPHVFLLGFPRSGTTLVENVLASLAGVAALEERPTLLEADNAYLMGNRAAVADGIARFAALDQAGLEHLRSAYWDKVGAAGVPAAARAFVDMDPLKGSRLPLIARLFPQARIVIMRRDPRDVVWSCFRTNFAMSSGTLEFTTLERAARHYDALMRLTDLARERLPLAMMELHYHRLVQDFDATTRELCKFLGLEWSEALRDFDRTAEQRGVATASAGQVRRGLYDGTRQWQPYARQFEPVMPILQPWIERFGYS